MYYIKSEESFDAAHFLKKYEGKCGNIHGHRWRVVASICGRQLKSEGNAEGMVLDFSELKDVLKELCERFDHKMIYETDSLKEKTVSALTDEGFLLTEVPFKPTAENFAKYFFDELKQRGYAAHRVEVYETPKNCAIYED